ncbi:hypothetical protein P1X14_15900 [Sphingomonas sp. AOB5]|uniref:glycine-rich domain-containing protein n=1 Tax=Sphingomonas sp. AOB5 TaxID=3034017 RepID=UPI0023F723E7|nr:hypothetical protein [Sphingomonas sp. AOB5]MDF7776741.1 hypothetical protein [Sphingomonas sp. AOB5]
MGNTERASCLAEPKLWDRLFHYLVGPEDAAFSFAQRLARENGWSLTQAERVILEYKRFCYLAVTARHPVTPSDAVDQVWHLHLTYTRDYWERFCPEILGRALHHDPTSGGPQEQQRYFEQYAETLKSYEQAFGTPPADLWPDAARRLNDDPRARRVHPREYLIIPRRALWWIVAMGAAALLVWMMIQGS